MPTIQRLLVANRGEIARRIQRAAAAMGIRTIAVYAAGDAGAPFVAEADIAVALGGRTAAETYLDIDKVLAAARRSGADAVHPGYGFLSESAAFAEAVVGADLVWVGPPPDVIDAMGDKLRAKRLMADAGVPVLDTVEVGPGGADPAALEAMPYPLLVKASAGGGGKGMRVVDRPEQLADAVAAAQREALAAFGDGTVFLERYLTAARHVEVQILGDQHGNLVHCFERECSIQRRHQKILEESPSPGIGEAVRQQLTDAALAAGRAVGYSSAGTVEFIVASDGTFAFLEVNTRLQVEHPVTEAVTGLDLVREQLLVAQGEVLSVTQEQLRQHGHAIEVRLYAEDPEQGFLPATGTVRSWQTPAQPAVRFDSGIESGSIVGVEFDPMLAKVIATAPTRTEAAQRLALALERTRIQGIVTNRDLLVAILRSPAFLAGDTTTSFLDDVAIDRRRRPSDDEVEVAAIAAALVAQAARRADAPVLRSLPSGWRNSVLPPQRTTFVHRDVDIVVEHQALTSGAFQVVAGATRGTAALHGEAPRCALEIDGTRRPLDVRKHGRRWWVSGPDGEVQLDEAPRFPEAVRAVVAGGLVAPMPGTVLSTAVQVGDAVVVGQVLAVIEAMKMEHRVVARSAGTVVEVRVAAGDQVAPGDVLVVVDEPEAEPEPEEKAAP